MQNNSLLNKSIQKKPVLSTTIAIDSEHSVFHFYSMEGNSASTIAHYVKRYTGNLFGEGFFDKFKDALREYSMRIPSDTVRKVTVVLPDKAVLTDIIKLPTMQGFGQTRKALSVTLESIYRNFEDLRGGSHVVDQNKQFSTFAVTAVQKQVVSSIYSACSENKMLVDSLSYESGAAVTGAQILNPRLKNSSFLFLDIKDIYTRCVFVAKGKPLGYYKLPFGSKLLREFEPIAEESLFNHSFADLAVYSAKNKAKSDKNTGDEQDYSNAARREMQNAAMLMSASYADIEKPPRDIPEALVREVPDTQEDIRYENFRIFVKWALSLIENNDRLTDLAAPEFVCVNLPDDLADVIDKTNAENAGDDSKGKNKTNLPFIRVTGDGMNVNIVSNLELYGGLFPKLIAPTGTL